MNHGRLFVLSGPSGAGKGTICDEIIKRGCAQLSVSMTTRAPRGKEIPGVSYFFVSEEEFDKTIENNGFLEYAGKYGKRYGTPAEPVLKNLDNGRDVILEIEMQGAALVKKNYPDAVLVFVLPPSLKILRERLEHRNSDSPEQIEQRSREAVSEIGRIKDYDYFVINDLFDDAVELVLNILKAEHNDEKASAYIRNNKVNEHNSAEIIERFEREAKN